MKNLYIEKRKSLFDKINWIGFFGNNSINQEFRNLIGGIILLIGLIINISIFTAVFKNSYLIVSATIINFSILMKAVNILAHNRFILLRWFKFRSLFCTLSPKKLSILKEAIDLYPDIGKELKFDAEKQILIYSFLYVSYLIKEQLSKDVNEKIKSNEQNKIKEIQQKNNKISSEIFNTLSQNANQEAYKNQDADNVFFESLSIVLKSSENEIQCIGKRYQKIEKIFEELKDRQNFTNNIIIEALFNKIKESIIVISDDLNCNNANNITDVVATQIDQINILIDKINETLK